MIKSLLISAFLFLFLNVSSVKNLENSPAGNQVKIYVIDNGVHTSIAVPLKTAVLSWDTIIPLQQLGGDNAKFTYLDFGWGDKGFYVNTPTWKDIRFGIAVKALFWPSPSVMKVDGYEKVRERPHKISINISESEYEKLAEYILNSFEWDQEGKPIKVAEGYDYHDAFYKAVGNYHLFNTSNTWTAKGLQAVGLPTPRVKILSKPIMRKLRKHLGEE
jgi:uncharacterized protein (TIGR02117 family)